MVQTESSTAEQRHRETDRGTELQGHGPLNTDPTKTLKTELVLDVQAVGGGYCPQPV